MTPTQSTLTPNGPPVEDDSSTTETSSPDSSPPTTSSVEAEESPDESAADSSRGPPSDIDEDQITTLDASSDVEEWASSCEADGLDYAYLHVQVDVYRTLTETWWGLRVATRESIIENSRNSYGGYVGNRRPDPDDLVDSIIDWVSSTLSTPYLSPDDHNFAIGHHLRSVPSNRIRVFISDSAVDFLTERDIPVEALMEVTRDVEEHTPSATYRELVADYYAAEDTYKSARSRIRGLEQAVGAAFGISTGYGGEVPSRPPDEFASLSPNDLQEELTSARESRDEAESRRDTLKENLISQQAAYASECASQFQAQVSRSASLEET